MISVAAMKKLEEKAEQVGVSRLTLMENAGKGSFAVLQQKMDLTGKKVLILCYHGNNGGDGFVVARYLADVCIVDVVFLGDETKLKKEALVNYRKVIADDRIKVVDEVVFKDYDIVVDAMLGTGTRGELKEPFMSSILLFNKSQGLKVSLDVPTGVDPDTGEVKEGAVNPDLIICFHALKKGLLAFQDKAVIVDIGIPSGL